ncbi:hypothetical protein, partial [Variovorax sp. KK3]
MSKPSEFQPGRGKRLGLRLAAVTGLAAVAAVAVVAVLQMPLGATAGVATVTAAAATADDRTAASLPPLPPVPDAAPASKHKGSGKYRLRCWQYGRLLFDEGPVTLGPEARQGAKLVALDRNGGSVIVTDSGWTTCQARP